MDAQQAQMRQTDRQQLSGRTSTQRLGGAEAPGTGRNSSLDVETRSDDRFGEHGHCNLVVESG